MTSVLAVWKTCDLVTSYMKLHALKAIKRVYTISEYKTSKADLKLHIRSLKKELKAARVKK